MNLLKRHLWLAATLGAMVVLSGVAAVLLLASESRRRDRQEVLEKSQGALGGSRRAATQYYNDDATKRLTVATEFRRKELRDIGEYVKRQGKWRELIPNIFPKYRTDVQVYNFKIQYQRKLEELAESLGAISFAEDKGNPALDAVMYTKANAFYKAPWIDETVLPASAEEVMTRLRESQDDLWLQEDIVGAIKRTNDRYFEAMTLSASERTIQRSVVKELHEIRIGAQFLPQTRGGGGKARRYLYIGEKTGDISGLGIPGAGGTATEEEVDESVKAGTLTGRASDNNKKRYLVLPFRVTVIADAGNYLELLRELTGTRSFMTVLNCRYEVIPEVESTYRSSGLMRPQPATRIDVYGDRALARLTVLGESLVFRLAGARPTTPPQETEAGAN